MINEFDNTQKINENKIICSICNKSKGKIYDNKFYFCGECNKNLCPLCKVIHNKEHNTLDYENKNNICNKHNEQYILFCNKCKENIMHAM